MRLGGRAAGPSTPTPAGPPISPRRCPTFAKITMSANECLHVSADTSNGADRIDLRVFAPFTPAKVYMPTKHAITVAAGLLPDLIAALQAAQAAIGAPA